MDVSYGGDYTITNVVAVKANYSPNNDFCPEFDDMSKGAVHPKDCDKSWLRVKDYGVGTQKRWVNTRGAERNVSALSLSQMFYSYRLILRKAAWRAKTREEAYTMAYADGADYLRIGLEQAYKIIVPTIYEVFEGNHIEFLNASVEDISQSN